MNDKMDPAIKAKWVKALRSGEYEQTRQRLHDSTGYCCLGVLCDLHAKETGNAWKPVCPTAGEVLMYCDKIGELPLPVQVWAGLADAVHHEMHLVNLNDAEQLSFPEIADEIERDM